MSVCVRVLDDVLDGHQPALQTYYPAAAKESAAPRKRRQPMHVSASPSAAKGRSGARCAMGAAARTVAAPAALSPSLRRCLDPYESLTALPSSAHLVARIRRRIDSALRAFDRAAGSLARTPNSVRRALSPPGNTVANGQYALIAQ